MSGAECPLCQVRPRKPEADLDRVLVAGLVVGHAAGSELTELQTVLEMCPTHGAMVSQAFAVGRVKQ